VNIFETLGPPKKTEPAWHPAVKSSFLFVPTAGMRVAPEVLILELYREIFFKQRSGSASAAELNPEDTRFSEFESAVLYATRGRKKRNHQSKGANFFTPAYPTLAKTSWLRKRADRVIKDFFFRALSQSIHGSGKESGQLVTDTAELIYDALTGTRSKSLSSSKLDILSLEIDVLEGCTSREESIDLLRDHLGEVSADADDSKYASVFPTSEDDPLAKTIYQDLVTLCELENHIDRLQWLELLKCFLRTATSVWLLAHMKMTTFVKDQLLETLTTSSIDVEASWPMDLVASRANDLLKPSATPTNQVHNHIDQYMRSRIELNLLIALIEKANDTSYRDQTLTLQDGGSKETSLFSLLLTARNSKEKVDLLLEGQDLRTVLTRESERYKAWVAPRKKGYGQGVNYDEFLRVLRRMTKGDEDGSYLLNRAGTGFIVFPGQQMIRLFCALASNRVQERSLVLSDIEHHFQQYGINFSSSAGARPRLINILQETGLLKGSPDAGDSVQISRLYTST
jgi:hypothetical protein